MTRLLRNPENRFTTRGYAMKSTTFTATIPKATKLIANAVPSPKRNINAENCAAPAGEILCEATGLSGCVSASESRSKQSLIAAPPAVIRETVRTASPTSPAL